MPLYRTQRASNRRITASIKVPLVGLVVVKIEKAHYKSIYSVSVCFVFI